MLVWHDRPALTQPGGTRAIETDAVSHLKLPPDCVTEGYRAMDQRRRISTRLRA